MIDATDMDEMFAIMDQIIEALKKSIDNKKSLNHPTYKQLRSLQL